MWFISEFYNYATKRLYNNTKLQIKSPFFLKCADSFPFLSCSALILGTASYRFDSPQPSLLCHSLQFSIWSFTPPSTPMLLICEALAPLRLSRFPSITVRYKLSPLSICPSHFFFHTFNVFSNSLSIPSSCNTSICSFLLFFSVIYNPLKTTCTWSPEYNMVYWNNTRWPKKTRKSRYSWFFRTLLWSRVIFFTLLNRASFPHYNNTKIIKFG